MAHEQLVGGIDVLGRSLTTLRIIVFALAAGVITFAGFVISPNLGKPHTLGGALNPMSTTLLAGGLIALVLGFVLPRLLFGSGRNLPINPPPGLTPEQLKMVTPDLVRLDAILQRLQSSTIIAGAFFEGGAFANVVGYMQTRELLHLILAGILTLAILALFPTRTRVQQRVDDMLRQAKDESSFART